MFLLSASLLSNYTSNPAVPAGVVYRLAPLVLLEALSAAELTTRSYRQGNKEGLLVAIRGLLGAQ